MSQSNQDKLNEMMNEHGWAVEIVRKHFSTGLSEISNERFLDRRYKEFEHKQDPVYAELLKGMGDEALSKTFVSYWTIAHTLATQSRFWLEDAVADIILEQARSRKRESLEVYSAKMLGAGYFIQRKPVSQLGEDELEHLTARSPWRVPMKTSVLSQIDLIVGEQERERPPERKPFQVRQWTSAEDAKAKGADEHCRSRIVSAFDNGTASDAPLQCNLLVVDPEKVKGTPCVYGFRFINPKTLSNHAARKQERVNLLRLYGYLVQEKIYTDPATIRVCVAELLPRYGDFDMSDRYPDYFSSATYWTCEKLWKFIGVPFEVVTLAIRAVAQEFRQKLIVGLRGLLPKPESQQGPSLFGR